MTCNCEKCQRRRGPPEADSEGTSVLVGLLWLLAVPWAVGFVIFVIMATS